MALSNVRSADVDIHTELEKMEILTGTMDVSVFRLAANKKNKRGHYYITLLQPLKCCCLLI